MLQLHSKHVVHRDLKSPSLLVDKHWRVKIGDFNLSRVEDTQEKTTSITANNPRWLAPEVISEQVRTGIMADPHLRILTSLRCEPVLYERKIVVI